MLTLSKNAAPLNDKVAMSIWAYWKSKTCESALRMCNWEIITTQIHIVKAACMGSFDGKTGAITANGSNFLQ